MKMRVALFSIALLASPAFAQTSDGAMSGSAAVLQGGAADLPEGASASGQSEDSERRICRRIDATSTRMPSRRLCLTAREWRDFNRRK